MSKIILDNFMLNYIVASGDEVFITDSEGNCLFKNKIAQDMYKNESNILKLAHLFNFEICILNSENILSYNPISAALSAKESFSSEVTKQTKDNQYIDYFLFSFQYSGDKKIIILRNKENKSLSLDNNDLRQQLELLNIQKIKLENQLVKSNLVNLISDTVREYIDTDKIIKIAIGEIKKTLNVTKIIFSEEHYPNNKVFSEFDDDLSVLKLIIPVCRENITYGALVLSKKDIQNVWQNDEIELLKNIAAIIATSFSKEKLYKKLEEQKKELEETLVKLENAQLQIVQSEKMAALGKLVAGVAHEINTPLGAISSNLNLLNKLCENRKSAEALPEFLKEIAPVNDEALRRIQTMVKSLKNFARLDEAKKKTVNITDGIDSSLTLLAHEIKNKIKITKNYSDLPLISCYPDYINQVFMNILLNACQSIKESGNITISTSVEDNFAKIKISDTGNGIPKETLKKIFDFGYTTKKLGQGTGLGLALAKKIVDEHNGKIEVESELNKGTAFSIYLPI